MMFKKIRKVLDDFEDVVKKADTCEHLTTEEECAIMKANFRLAEALTREWSGADNVAMMILIESQLLERIEVKFNNNIK